MEKRISLSPKLLAVIALCLVIVIGVTAWFNNTDRNTDGSTLMLLVNGEEKASYSIKELMGMEKTTVHAELQSGKSEDEKGDFTGVTLELLLKTANIKNCETVIMTAGDGYSSAAKSSEAKDVLIAYEKDGDTLGYYEKGGTGPLRCIFFKDAYGNRSVQYLTKIDCR